MLIVVLWVILQSGPLGYQAMSDAGCTWFSSLMLHPALLYLPRERVL